MQVELVIIVPVFNEAENVPLLVEEVAAALATVGHSFELVFVDDGSADHSWAAICGAQRLNSWVHGLRHVKRLGQSEALWTGFQATHSRLIATLDGDLQNDPADLPGLLAELESADLICGVRTQRQDGWRRRVSSQIARWVRKAALGIDFSDTGCGLKVFKRSALAGVFGFRGFHRFLLVLAHWNGAIIKEMPINHRPRKHGRAKYGIWNRIGCGMIDLLAMAWFNQRRLIHPPYLCYEQKQRSDHLVLK
jgi:dolichol-phosphate mannosyltransferase